MSSGSLLGELITLKLFKITSLFSACVINKIWLINVCVPGTSLHPVGLLKLRNRKRRRRKRHARTGARLVGAEIVLRSWTHLAERYPSRPSGSRSAVIRRLHRSDRAAPPIQVSSIRSKREERSYIIVVRRNSEVV